MIFKSIHPETKISCVIVDDGDAGMAFLHGLEDEIIGDVWLYNRVAEAAFDTHSFVNPVGQIINPLPQNVNEFNIKWMHEGQLLLAQIYIHNVLVAIISPGSHPGWATLALSDSALAHVLGE
jgi:hypothetical protein